MKWLIRPVWSVLYHVVSRVLIIFCGVVTTVGGMVSPDWWAREMCSSVGEEKADLPKLPSVPVVTSETLDAMDAIICRDIKAGEGAGAQEGWETLVVEQPALAKVSEEWEMTVPYARAFTALIIDILNRQAEADKMEREFSREVG